MMRFVKEKLDRDIYMVFGGFHLLDMNEEQLRSVINEFQDMGVQKAGPCHCSGDQCIQLFKQEYREDLIDIGVGSVISIQ